MPARDTGSLIYALTLGICAGVALAFLLPFSLWCAGGFIAVAGVCVLSRQPLALLVAIACAAAVIGMLRVELLKYVESRQTLPLTIGTTAVIEGVVAADPDRRATSVRVNVAVQTIGGNKGSGTLLAVLPRENSLHYGDTVEVRGLIEAPQAFQTDTGRLFDYPSYLRVQRISALMQRATLVSTKPAGFSLMGTLFALKHSFESSIERVLPEPDASLLEGVTLGERRGLPPALTTAFVIASLIHVVVLSGYNISIVAEAVLRGTRFLPKHAGYALGILLMILFVLMTGAGSTSLRACIMALIAIAARYFHRSALALRSLALAALLLVLWNPLVLLFDPSFILSFLATLGLVTLGGFVESNVPKFFGRVPQLRSIAASTIAVQIFVLPALLYFTGVLSFVALPSNILTLPLVPFAMFMGFVAGVLGLIHPLFGLLPALLCDLVLKWMIFVATTAASFPLSHIVVPSFPAWIVLLFYIPLTFVALICYHKTRKVVM